MKALRITFSVFIGLFLLVLFMFLTMFYSANESILKPYSTTEYLEKSGTYKVLSDNASELFIKNELDNEIVDMQNISKNVVEDFITEEWLKEKVNFMQTEIWDYILNKDKELSNLNVSGLKQEFLNTFEAKINKENIGENAKEMVLDNFSSKFDSNINWAEMYGINTTALDKWSTLYNKKNTVFNYSILIAFALLALGSTLLLRINWIMIYTGIIGVISSITLLPSYLMWKLIPMDSIKNELSNNSEFIFIDDLFVNLIDVIAKDFTYQITLNSLMTFGASVVLLSASKFIKK